MLGFGAVEDLPHQVELELVLAFKLTVNARRGILNCSFGDDMDVDGVEHVEGGKLRFLWHRLASFFKFMLQMRQALLEDLFGEPVPEHEAVSSDPVTVGRVTGEQGSLAVALRSCHHLGRVLDMLLQSCHLL